MRLSLSSVVLDRRVATARACPLVLRSCDGHPSSASGWIRRAGRHDGAWAPSCSIAGLRPPGACPFGPARVRATRRRIPADPGGRGANNMRAMSAIAELGRRARAASRVLATASTEAKDAALIAAADLLVERNDDLL